MKTQQINTAIIDPAIINRSNIFLNGKLFSAEVNEIFVASSSKLKCDTAHGVILVAEVIHGQVRDTDKVTLESNGQVLISDIICRLEQNQKPVDCVTAGQYVGICLTETKLETIKKSLQKILV